VNVESIAVDEVLLVLRVAFLVLLYLFIWRIVRTASKDILPQQESFIDAPAPPRLGPDVVVGGGGSPGRLVVVQSPTLTEGDEHAVNSQPITIGRSSSNELELRGDRFASARHARVESRRDGVWVVDDGSTNGTYVNGVRLEQPRLLSPGDVVRVGETHLRYEP
jgi:hypothetical protein